MTDNKRESVLRLEDDTLNGYGILPPELHPAYFPLTYDEQEAVSGLLRYTARIAYADQLGELGAPLRDGARHGLERHAARLEAVGEGFAALMHASVLNVVDASDIVHHAKRVKAPDRTVAKVVEKGSSGVDHAVKDVFGFMVVVHDGVSPDGVIAAIQQRHRIPVVYPGGRASLKVGRGVAHHSDPDYMVRNLALVFHDDEGVVHLGELRVLDESEFQVQLETRDGYVQRRAESSGVTPSHVANFVLGKRFI